MSISSSASNSAGLFLPTIVLIGVEMSISSSASNSAGLFLPTIVLIGVEDLWMQLDIGDRILLVCSGLGKSDFAVE